MTFAEFSRANLQRCRAAFRSENDWSPMDWACAMAGECGEACNLIKKLRRGQDITVESIGKELADVVTYVDLLAARLGIDLEVAIINKFNEVSDRCGSAIKLGEQ